MTEYEKAEQEVAAAKVSERVAEWKAMEAKAVYYRYASEAMQASAEVMGARIRRDNAIASEFADKAIAALSTETEGGLLDPESPPVDDEVRNQAEDEAAETRPCTCHPLDRPETCQHKYALNDCLKSAYVAITATPFITGAERPSDESQATDQDRVELKQTESSSQASSTEATGADVSEENRDETWVPPPGYTYIPTQGERCVCVNLMQDGIGNFFCCNQRGEATAEAERTEVDSPPTKQDRVEPLPSGIQFRVDGGPLQTTGQEPAAFAPVNAIEEPDTDALMWANGFEADAKSKAEPEQDKRPFWMFAKPKVDA